MEKIWFRAKQSDTRDWVYGYPVKVVSTAGSAWMMVVPPADPDTDGKQVFIDENTIGGWTGLTDKGGKWIFKGDILKGFDYPFYYDGKFNYFAEVVWFENSPAFGIYTIRNPQSNVIGRSEGNSEHLGDFDNEKWEVIGNIYDNPELIGWEDPE